MGIKTGKKRFLAAAMAFVLMFCASCGKDTVDDEVSSAPETVTGKTTNRSEEEDKNGFFYTWKGEAITTNKADMNGLIRLGSNTAISQERWADFSENVRLRQSSTLMITDGDSITKIDTSISGEDYIALIQKKVYENGRSVSTGQYVSPAKLCCVKNKDTDCYEYYFSDCLVYTCPVDVSEGTDNSYDDIPADFKAYSASPDAGISFPFQKTFSSMSDFEAYYEKYNDILGLDELKADMDGYSAKGNFNTNVFFLYADMADNDNAVYEFLRAVKQDNALTIYLKRSMPGQKASGLSKWQLVCKVSGEYLHEVDPNNIEWVIYNDVITKG